MKSEDQNEEQIDKIFKELDIKSYEAFLAAGIDYSKLLTEDLLERMFKMIDVNGDGQIIHQEFKTIFSEKA